MLHVSYYIVCGVVEEDQYGYVAPVYFDLDELKEDYPDHKYIEVEVDSFDIGLN